MEKPWGGWMIPPALSRPFFGGLPSSSGAFLRTVGRARAFRNSYFFGSPQFFGDGQFFMKFAHASISRF